MLSYELAKKLHDAHYGCIGPWDEPHRCSALHCNHCGLCSQNEEDWELPTLSKLIEACGDKDDEIFGLIHFKSHKDVWIAGFNWDADFEGRSGESGSGKTPEEAVVRLWLKLHGIN